MEAEIGSAAGAIWRYLDQHGPATLARLKQATRLSDQLLLMGVGWLAREDKLEFTRESRTLRLGLRSDADTGQG